MIHFIQTGFGFPPTTNISQGPILTPSGMLTYPWNMPGTMTSNPENLNPTNSISPGFGTPAYFDSAPNLGFPTNSSGFMKSYPNMHSASLFGFQTPPNLAGIHQRTNVRNRPDFMQTEAPSMPGQNVRTQRRSKPDGNANSYYRNN